MNHTVYSQLQQNKYDTLQGRLLTEFADSYSKRFKKFLSEIKLGDSKPSTLFRQMRDLAACKLNEDFLQNLWLQRLPTNIQAILLASNENLPQLAVFADNVEQNKLKNWHCKLRKFLKKGVNLPQGVTVSRPEANLEIEAKIRAIPTMKILATSIIVLVVFPGSVGNLAHSSSRETSKRYHPNNHLER